jgi:aspartate kinase
MIIIKFGGTSVGDAQRVANAIDIVAERRDLFPIVVVSALSGVTNDLVAASEAARACDADRVNQIIAAVRQRHEDVAMRLVQQKFDFFESFIKQLDKQIDQIHTILSGIALLGEITPRAKDKVVAIGEKLSSVLFAYSMMMRTLPGEHVDSEEVVITDARFGEASPLMDDTREAAHRVLLPLIERNRIPVMGGFIGRTRDGATTTLGRGGSDYSAAIIGAAAGAEEIQIWTDVDGMMTCDPRLIPTARIIERISYVEAAELAWFGAKVLHPRTIAPAVARKIAVRVLNTHNVASPGTLITEAGDENEPAGPRAVAVKRGITVVHMTSNKMLGAHGFLARLFAIFEELEVSVDLITTSEVSVSVTIDEDNPRLLEKLKSVADVQVIRDQCIVAIVGRNLMRDSIVGARVFEAMRGIPMSMFSLGTSGLNLSIVVDDKDADRSVRAVHTALFEAPGKDVIPSVARELGAGAGHK